MTRFLLLVVMVLVATASARTWAADLPRVPEGYTVEIVAEAPLVKHPMLATFDDRGRLFIAESAGTNRRAEELVEEPLDFIRVLEDTDGDGRFDDSTIFADKLTFPQGVLCYEGAVYTCAPPYVWKLEDTNGDGVCDKRTVLVESFGFNGNAASIHGPFLGPDGRLYWCDGRHGHEFFDESGQLVSKGKAARIFSCLPDGSDVQTFCGGGMDNPVEVDWLDSGEMIGTVNLFYGRPRGDCLVHWVEGGVYPRFDQQDCIDEFPWTGGLLPEIHNYGHVAVSGMCVERSPAPLLAREGDARPQATAGPEETIASVLVTQFNTHKIVRTTLARDGSTFKPIADEDLIVWDNPDVHPTDVLEAPDGSILVIDTGGWFRIGCPTSQIAKPEIPGAIYRIRKQPAIVATSLLSPGATTSLPINDALDQAAAAREPHARLAAMQVISRAYQPRRQRPEQPTEQVVDAIFAGLNLQPPDRHLAHSIITALIRVNDPAATRRFLLSDLPHARRAAVIALDQMEQGRLTEADVIPLLETDNPELLQAVLQVISRHEGWVAETVPMFRSWLMAETTTPQRLESMRTFFLAQPGDLWVQELVGDALSHAQTHPQIRRMLVDVVTRAEIVPLPPLWGDGLSVPLGLQSDPDSRLAAMRAIGSLRLDQHDPLLSEILLFDGESSLMRIEAFSAMAARIATVPPDLFDFIQHGLTGEGDLIERLTLARGVADVTLSSAQLQSLAESFVEIGPAVVPVLLPAFEKSPEEAVGTALVAGLTRLGDSLSLSLPELDRLLERYPESTQQQAQPLRDALGIDADAQASRLEELLTLTATGGDPSRGRTVFFGKAVACGGCHRIGDEGAQVGPALSNIGAIRQPRDLLEAIAFPSASFAREYRPYLVVMDDGRVHTGIITATTSDSVILKTADLKDLRIPRASIDVMQMSDTSIMPKGLDSKLSATELRDLLAYLVSLRG